MSSTHNIKFNIFSNSATKLKLSTETIFLALFIDVSDIISDNTTNSILPTHTENPAEKMDRNKSAESLPVSKIENYASLVKK